MKEEAFRKKIEELKAERKEKSSNLNNDLELRISSLPVS